MAPFAVLGMATGVGDFLVRFLVVVFAVAVELVAALAIAAEVVRVRAGSLRVDTGRSERSCNRWEDGGKDAR